MPGQTPALTKMEMLCKIEFMRHKVESGELEDIMLIGLSKESSYIEGIISVPGISQVIDLLFGILSNKYAEKTTPPVIHL